MHKITYRITTLSPVLITTNVGDINTVNTGEFINGNSVLGIFASSYIKKKNLKNKAHEDDNFYRWFLKGDLKFTGGYIITSDKYGKKKNYFPLPMSVQHEKNDTNTIFDLLFLDEDDCEEIQTKALVGFGYIKDDMVETCEIKKSLNFHHARDKNTGISKEGQIFNYESIDEGQIFEGNITGDEKDLIELTKTFEKEQTVYLGRSKNAQYGKVRLEIDGDIKKFTSEIEGLDIEEETSMTLLSDLIIYNDNGFPTTDLKTLEKYTGLKFKKAFIRTGEIENFVSVWHIRKPSEVSFRAGSTFLIEIPEREKDRMLKLQSEGTGERRHEGFGRIVFGWQKEENLKKQEEKGNKPEKPAFPITALTRQIIEETVKETIRKEITLKAITEMGNFKKYPPTKSLLGRLEMMVGECSQTEFAGKLGKLRKTARDKLERCRSDKETLFKFLENVQIDINKILNEQNHIRELSKEINFSPAGDLKFCNKLYRLYLTTFFSTMRKKEKGGR
ncbi:MAG: RAMP superfamily CRISPR-associated protein [Candidatus Eremiobacterota bacterium]